ncbi:MAG: hypothetical protein C0467_28705 [Planctomycetaceae bacterium]|nr:hypothetical protein [Planctomycetaceae bacterium]
MARCLGFDPTQKRRPLNDTARGATPEQCLRNRIDQKQLSAGTSMLTSPPAQVYDWAHRYLAAGLSVIPVSLDGSKAPAFAGWREYSEQRPTTEQVDRWFRAGRYGIGIPCGPASGHLVVLDFETRKAFDDWCSFLTPEDKNCLIGSPVVATPKDGVHVYVRLEESVKGTKYARTAEGACLIETRGNGHQVVAPGSPLSVHPSSKPYRLIRAGWVDGEPCRIMPLNVYHNLTIYCAELNEHTKPAAHEVVGDRLAAGEAGDRPGDQFNDRIAWGDLLIPHGWRVFRSTDTATYWTRPGKTPAGISASTGHCRGPSGRDLLYVFSSSATPFEPERSYSRFAAYAMLNHHGDFTAATRALGQAGYGTPARKVVLK